MAFAKVMLIGNLGRDPEMRYTPSGRPVTEFSVAVGYSKRDPNTNQWVDESTDWYRVTIWGDRGERAAEQLRKGMRVFVEGRFRTREYEARDGQKRISLEVTADDVISLDRGARGEGDAPAFPAEGGRPASTGVSPIRRPAAAEPPGDPGYGDLDDLPF